MQAGAPKPTHTPDAAQAPGDTQPPGTAQPLGAKLLAHLRKYLRKYAAAAIVLLVLLAYAAGSNRWLASAPHTPHSQPYEYVYLDSARVDSYLGQLTGGDIGSENRSETTTNSANGTLQFGTLGNLSGSTSKQLTTSAVVTQSEADRFYELIDDLKKDEALTTVSARTDDLPTLLAPQQVPAGTMVRIEHAFVHVPPYLSAYPQLRYASYLIEPGEEVFEHPALTQFNPSEVALVRNAKKGREAFITAAGEDPRLPFSVSPQGLTIVIPARYANLTGDPSLLSTDLTVVGKVVFNGTNYGDGISETTYLPALLGSSSSFLGYLGVKKANLQIAANSSSQEKQAHEVALHRKLFQALVRSLSFKGRVVEVIPVAIYD